MYILLWLLLVWFLFAVVGITCFRKNDPFHFGGLGIAMLTLYRIATFESWTAIMYINYFGCDGESNSMSGWYYGDGGGPSNAPLAMDANGNTDLYPHGDFNRVDAFPDSTRVRINYCLERLLCNLMLFICYLRSQPLY